MNVVAGKISLPLVAALSVRPRCKIIIRNAAVCTASLPL